MNAPVPFVFFLKSKPDAISAALAMNIVEFESPTNRSRNVTFGFASVMRTVKGSGASIFVKLLTKGAWGAAVFGSLMRLSDARTSSASKVEPSWNVTPFRRWKT